MCVNFTIQESDALNLQYTACSFRAHCEAWLETLTIAPPSPRSTIPLATYCRHTNRILTITVNNYNFIWSRGLPEKQTILPLDSHPLFWKWNVKAKIFEGIKFHCFRWSGWNHETSNSPYLYHVPASSKRSQCKADSRKLNVKIPHPQKFPAIRFKQ